jgi:putative hydrolase of the HAD superfamily
MSDDDKIFRSYVTPLKPRPTGERQSGRLTGQLHCILFDIYGTLLISGSGDIGTAEKTARDLSKLTGLLEKYHIPGSGKDFRDMLFEHIRKEHDRIKKSGIEFPEVNIVRIWESVIGPMSDEHIRAFALEFEMIVNPVYPMPHLADLLAACRRNKIKMGIISNAQFYTQLLLEWFLKSDLKSLGFTSDLVFLSYLFGQGKPSPYLFKRAREQLDSYGIEPDSVLYLGNDMLNDIYPAHRSGFQTALFAGDARSLRRRRDDPRCSGLTPDLVVTDLNQVADLLTGIS